MRIADLNTSSLYTRQVNNPSGLSTLDSTGKLYKATLEKANRRDAVAPADTVGEAFVYSRSGIKIGGALATNDVVLENADGSRFTLDTTGKTVSLVAKGQNIDLYVYTPPGNGQPASSANAVKYSFNQNGVMAASGVSSLSATDFSAAEISTRRDLDGNGKLGGKLSTATATVNGKNVAVATAGIFKVNVMGQDLFVVGSNNLEKQSTINAQNATLLDTDGSTPWSPTESVPGKTFSTYRAVKSGSGEWDVYATDSAGEVTRFQFDATRTLKANGIKTLTGSEVVSAEVSAKRDLNADGNFGAEIVSTADAQGKLYKAKLAGADVYLSKVADTQTDTTGGKPVSADGSLLNTDGTAWAGPGTGYSITSVTAGTKTVNAATVNTRTVYAKDTTDANKILKFNFTADGTNFSLDKDSVIGISVDATEMATAEKTAKRDLNGDSKFGVDITSTVDATGGLYKGSILGKSFYVAGSGLKTGTTGSLAQDLAGALLNADGTAWGPTSGYKVGSIVSTTTNGAVTGYTAYAYKDAVGQTPADRTDILKFEFNKPANSSNWTVTTATQFGIKIDAKTLSDAEKAATRDLNGDGQFGVSLNLSALDASGGLWKGDVFGQSYVIADATSGLKSSANNPLDLSKALLNADGTAWSPTELAAQTGKLRVVVDSASTTARYTVYASTQQGTANATYAKYTFGSDFKQTGNKTELTTEQFAAAEKTTGKDLNDDSKFGVNITQALDSRGGLYQGSLDGKTGVYFKGAANLTPGSKVAADAMNFDTALKTSTGYWTPDTGYDAKSLVADSVAHTITVIAAKSSDNTIKKYVFDDATYTLKGDQSGDMKLADLVALENAQTTPRDLNGDGITGVQTSATPPDAVGGLFKLTAGGSTVLAVGTGANHTTAPTDLSTTLQNADGTTWSATGSVDRYTLTSSANGFTLYTKVGSDYTEYTFGSDYKLDASKTRSTLAANDASGAATLDNFKLADLEKSLSRDINGDSTLGAKITSSPVTDKIHLASFNNTTYTVVNTTAGVTSTALTDKALLNADGTRWSASAGMTIKAANINANASTELYAAVTSGGSTSYQRLTFGSDGKLLKTDTATAEQIADSGALGTLSTSSVDSAGGLFKTTVLGTDYYVAGTGANNGTAPVDLSRALMLGNTGTAAAWSPLTGTGSTGAGTAGNPVYQVGGMVTNKTGATVDSYDVYAYATNASGTVTDVFKSTWDSSFNYQGTTRADPLALVDVENTTGRDLNKDGAFGFKLVNATTPESTYKGVTVAQVGGSSVTFLLAGNDLNPGTSGANNALTIDKALLNEAGSGAWAPDSGYAVTSVAAGAAGTRYVYAKKAGANGAADEYMRYAFSTTTGKSQGAGTAMSAKEMAAEELTRSNTDLDADGQVGAVSISTYKVSASNATSTGLLQASYGNQTFFVAGTLPTAGAKMNLSASLVQADGKTPWAADTGFTVTAATTGASTVAASGTNTFVYARKLGTGAAADEFLRYEFDGSTGQSLGAGVAVTAVDMAKAELAAAGPTDDRDLNGDGQVGALSVKEYKVGNNTTSTGLLQATLGNQSFLVAGTLPAAGTPMDLSKALLKTDGTAWSADTGYTATGTADGPVGSGLRYVYAKKTSGSGPEFQRYSFDTTTNKVVGSAVEISAVDMAAAEVTASKDYNADNQVGGTSVSAFKVGNNDTSTGLLNVSYGGQTFKVAASMPAAGTNINLSHALKAADGVTPWAVPSADATAGYTLKAFATDSSNSKLYAYAAKAGTNGAADTFKRYEFDATSYESLDSGVEISAVDLAALEVSGSSDLNGDNQKGAISLSAYKVGNNDTSTGLLNASFGGKNYLIAASMPAAGTSIDLSKALKNADGSTWAAPGNTETVTAAITAASTVAASGNNIFVYTRTPVAGNVPESYTRYEFDGTNGKAVAAGVAVSSVEMAKAELNASVSTSDDKDLNGDNQYGTVSISEYKVVSTNTTSTGLLNAKFGSQTYLVADSLPASGGRLDLSKALLQADGKTPWAADSGYTATAAVTSGSTVTVYARRDSGTGPEFQRYTFSTSTYEAQGSAEAISAVDLAAAEVTATKDLNGDNKVGATAVSTYKVSTNDTATGLLNASFGSQNFLVVDSMPAAGTNINLSKALKGTDGATAWSVPDSGYSAKAAVSTAGGYSVYAANNSNSYKRYDFDASGISKGAGVAVSLGEMANLEASAAGTVKDFNGDNKVGAVVQVADYKYTDMSNGSSRSTGLLKATMGGSTFFIVKDSSNSNAGVDLKKSLLDTAGAAWALPTGFVIRGIREDTASSSNVLEVYGTTTAGNGAVSVYQFKKETDANGAYTGSYKATSANPLTLSEIASGNLEYDYDGVAATTTSGDLNGDGVIGFKANNTALFQESAKFSGAVTLGTAGVGSSNIYYVTTDNATTKTQASGANIKAGALMVDNGDALAYWSPTSSDGVTTYTIKSVDHTSATSVEVWVDKATSGTSDGLVRFTFAQASAGDPWILDAAGYETDYASNLYKGMTALQLAAEEAGSGYAFDYDGSGALNTTAGYTAKYSATGRDLNGDGVVGISLTQQATGSNIDSNVYKTTIDSVDYYLVGANLSSGTEANPMALDTSKILMADATTVWTPSGSVTGWSALDPISAKAIQTTGSLTDLPQYVATDGGNPVYFINDGTNIRVAV